MAIAEFLCGVWCECPLRHFLDDSGLYSVYTDVLVGIDDHSTAGVTQSALPEMEADCTHFDVSCQFQNHYILSTKACWMDFSLFHVHAATPP